MNAIIEKIGLKAQNLFVTRQLMCSEAVFSVINGSLGGGLPDHMAIRIASGLGEGMGGSGCTCGALSGGMLAMGLFLGRDGPGFLNGRKATAASRKLHDAFRKDFGATCCRILIKHLQRGSAAHYRECAQKCGMTARTAAELILTERPDLLKHVDTGMLETTDSLLTANIKRVSGLFR